MWVFFKSRRRHTRCSRDWSSDVCSSDLGSWSFVFDMLDLPDGHQLLQARIRENRPFAADKVRAELAMAAEADPALHVSFHGEIDLRRIDAELKELHGRKPHHDLRSAYHRQGICRIERCFGEEAGNDADMSLPASNGAVHRHENVEIKTRTPLFA